MKLAHCAGLLVTAAVASLAPAATAITAAASVSAASTPPAQASACRVTATVGVGGAPLGIAANRITNTVYVTNAGFPDNTCR